MKLNSLFLLFCAAMVHGQTSNRSRNPSSSTADGTRAATAGGNRTTTSQNGGRKVMVVGRNGSNFEPENLDVSPGDVVTFLFPTDKHNVRQSDEKDGCTKSTTGKLNWPAEGLAREGSSWNFTVPESGDVRALWIYCQPHCEGGMTASLTFTDAGGAANGGSNNATSTSSGSSITQNLGVIAVGLSASMSFF